MKVINTWDGEPARTPTQIVKDWYAEYKDEMNLGGIDGFHTTELMAALAPLFAAGPWRADVENAPKEGVILVIAHTGEIRAVSFNPLFDCWTDDEYHVWQYNIDAFATINPPEIEG